MASAFRLEAGKEGEEQYQGGRKKHLSSQVWEKRDEEEEKEGQTGAAPSCLSVGEAANCSHRNKASNGEPPQRQSLSIL